MAKIKSSLTNMLLSLTIISLVAAGLLAGVYTLTKDTIDETNAKIKADAKKEVLKMDDIEVAEEGIQAGDITIYPATKNVNGEQVVVGAAVETKTAEGFSGEIVTMVGFDNDGNIKGFKVLKHAETPGLGAKAQDWFSAGKGSIIDKNPGQLNFTVSKDGGDVDAITAATITSRAFLSSIKKAYDTYTSQPVEATTCETPKAEAEDAIVEPTNEEE